MASGQLHGLLLIRHKQPGSARACWHRPHSKTSGWSRAQPDDHCLRIRLGHPEQLRQASCCPCLRFVPQYKAGKAPRNLLNSIESTSPRRLARPRTSPFHGGNTGSNPVGDAKHSKRLKFDLASSFHVTVYNVKLAPPVKPLFSAQSSQQPSIAPCVSHLSLPACRRPS